MWFDSLFKKNPVEDPEEEYGNYITVVQVKARKINRNTAKKMGLPISKEDKHIKCDLGYEVKYGKVYKEWWSFDLFKNVYTPIFNQALADTCGMMISRDYKERFKAEYYQLRNRYENLKAMVEKWDTGELSFTPTCPRELYDAQLGAMENYKKVLEMRADLESVDL